MKRSIMGTASFQPARAQRGRSLGRGLRHRWSTRGIAPLEGRSIASPAYHRRRSEEHTSELQSLMRISYAVFCLKKKKKKTKKEINGKLSIENEYTKQRQNK